MMSRASNPTPANNQKIAIRIACRVRPSLPHEVENRLLIPSQKEHDEAIDCDEDKGLVQLANKGTRYKFTFSSVHSPESTQLQVFQQDVAPMLDQVYSGISCTVFSYGVTGSGKTHTMQGVPTSAKEMGIIPRVVKALFIKRARMKKVKIDISCEYLEIYKDECFDLLVPRSGGAKLDVRTNDKGQNVVAGLTQKEIKSVEEFDAIYNAAAAHRSTASTKLNAQSSRSHAVLTIQVRTEENKENGKIFVGRVNLVDLAGSENNKLTGNDRERMAESSAINKSLTVLGNVIDSLNKGLARVPYRDSKLTRILQDTLGGSSVGLLICNLSPSIVYRQDTINTLNFAQRTKEVENRVTVTESKPAPKLHFAALTKPVRQVPVFRDANSSKPAPPSSEPIVAKPKRTVLSNVGNQRADGIVKAISGKAVAGGLKGKGKAEVEEDMEAKIAALVEEALSKKLAELEQQTKSAPVNPPTPSRTDLKDRVEMLERKMKLQADKAAATELLDTARKHHDRAVKESSREQLALALSVYKSASSFLPSNRAVIDRIAELQDCIDNDLPIPSRKKSTSSSSTAASFSAAPSRSRTSHPTSTTASDNIPPPKDLSPPARPVSSLKRSRKQESLVQLQLPSQSPQPNIFDDIIPNLPQPSPSHADTTDEFDRYDDEDAEPRRPTKKRSLPPSAAALPSTRAKAPNSTTSKPTVASSKRSKKAAPSSPAPLLAPDSWDELPKPRPVRVSGTAANRILARRASDSSDDEDDLGGYDVSQDGEWVPEVVERAGGRRTGAGKRR